jgi:hypothetical protein
MSSSARPVVVGVADHTGWAILVSAAADKGAPVVVDRRGVKLIEAGVPSQPYEHDTLGLTEDKAEELLRNVRRSVATCTARALAHLAGDLGPGYRVAAVAIRKPTLERLPTASEAHANTHVRNRADGMLYHSAIREAARELGWDVCFHSRGDELELAAAALRARPDDVEDFLIDLRRTLRPPWSVEHRSAFAAAISRLGTEARLRALGSRPRDKG